MSNIASARDPRRDESPMPTNAAMRPAAPTTATAARTAQDRRFRDNSDMTLTLRVVGRGLKGGGAQTLTVVQSGGLWPDPDFKGASLSIDEASPLLLPGERAILLLDPERRRPGAFRPQSVSGIYKVVDRRVRSVRGNPFGKAVEGLRQGELAMALRAASAKCIAPYLPSGADHDSYPFAYSVARLRYGGV